MIELDDTVASVILTDAVADIQGLDLGDLDTVTVHINDLASADMNLFEEIYDVADAEKYEKVEKSNFADPEHRAFPCNSAKRCRSAMVYLIKYYHNNPDSGVTADYDEAKFKSVHNRIVAKMKDFGIEHGGCDICNSKRKEAASMDKKDDVQEPSDAIATTDDVPTEPVVTDASNEPAPDNSDATDAATDAAVDDSGDAEPASGVATLEATLAEKEATILALQEELASTKVLHSRMLTLAGKGLSVSENFYPVVSSLSDDEFGLFADFLLAKMQTPAVTDDVVADASDEPAADATDEPVDEPSNDASDASDEPVVDADASDEPTDEPVVDADASTEPTSADASMAITTPLNLEGDGGRSKKDYFKAIWR